MKRLQSSIVRKIMFSTTIVLLVECIPLIGYEFHMQIELYEILLGNSKLGELCSEHCLKRIYKRFVTMFEKNLSQNFFEKI